MTGCVVDTPADVTPPPGLRDVVAVLDDEPFLPPAVVDLAIWIGDYYASGPGDALAIAMPPSARRGREDGTRRAAFVELAPGWNDTTALKGPRQRAAVSLLTAHARGLLLADLSRRGVGATTVRSLERIGVVRVRQETVERNPVSRAEADPAHWLATNIPDDRTLNDDQ